MGRASGIGCAVEVRDRPELFRLPSEEQQLQDAIRASLGLVAAPSYDHGGVGGSGGGGGGGSGGGGGGSGGKGGNGGDADDPIDLSSTGTTRRELQWTAPSSCSRALCSTNCTAATKQRRPTIG
eukprot:scaffold9812_cov56-Phaeocystis_antarctica.AAC.3